MGSIRDRYVVESLPLLPRKLIGVVGEGKVRGISDCIVTRKGYSK